MSTKRVSNKQQTYALCLFIEENNGKQEEQKTVVPKRWLDQVKKILWWPKGINVTSKKFSDPDEKSWDPFKLVKVLEEGEEKFCFDMLAFTSASENDAPNGKKDTRINEQVALPTEPRKSVMSMMKTPSHQIRSARSRSRSNSREKSRSRSHSRTSSRSRSSSRSSSSSSSRSNSVILQVRARSRSSSPARPTTSDHGSHSSIQRSKKDRSGSGKDGSNSSKYRSRSSSPARPTKRDHGSHSSVQRSKKDRSGSGKDRSIANKYRSRSDRSSSGKDRLRSGDGQSSSSSNARSDITSRSRLQLFNPRKDSAGSLKERFPMEQGEFQRRVLSLLGKTKQCPNCQCTCNGNKGGNMEKDIEDMVKVDTVEELTSLEDKLANKEEFNKLVIQLKRIGGKTTKENAKAVMTRLIALDVMAKFNMKGKNRGNADKKPFQNLTVCKAIVESVRHNHADETESVIREHIGNVLRYAPFLGGKKKDKENDDNTFI